MNVKVHGHEHDFQQVCAHYLNTKQTELMHKNKSILCYSSISIVLFEQNSRIVLTSFIFAFKQTIIGWVSNVLF